MKSRNEMSGADPAKLSEDSDQSRMQRKNEYKKQETRGWIFSLAAAIIVALLLRFFVFEFIRVEGESMEPTLYSNEFIFMEKVTYYFSEPQRGDIVICKFPNHSDTYVKRVIGIEGDTLEITDGVLYINGEANYDYYNGIINADLSAVTVPQNAVMVMGDNRNESMDSRNSSIGALPYNMILGKAIFVLWPLDQIHGLK